MRHLLILGFALAVLTATCSAQGTQMPRTERSYADRTKSAKSGVGGPQDVEFFLVRSKLAATGATVDQGIGVTQS